VPEADGAYTLKAPRKRSIVFTVKGGVHSRFRIGDGLKPSVGADLGLEFELTSRHWAFVLGPEWRYEPRSIQNGSTAEPSVPSSAIAITGQALLCAPCAGSAPSLGWLGLEVGVAAEYPFLANPQQTGDWTGEPEGGIVYRLQPDHDGIWGMTLLVGAAGDSKFFVNQAAFQGFVGLRTGLAAWLYLN
jgi:hypothetical protein